MLSLTFYAQESNKKQTKINKKNILNFRVWIMSHQMNLYVYDLPINSLKWQLIMESLTEIHFSEQ